MLGEIAPLAQIGASGVLLAAVWWIFRYSTRQISTGEWVPRRELDYTRADRDARLAEKDATIAEWRAAHDTSERTRELLNGQNRDLIDALRAQERFFDAFRAFFASIDRDGAASVERGEGDSAT